MVMVCGVSSFGPILLVEDHPNDTEFLSLAIGDSGVPNHVLVARDGQEALALLESNGIEPSLVVIDLKLPGLDGLRLLERIRSRPRLAYIPVVVFTGSILADDVAASYDRLANAYLVKPADFGRLTAMMKSTVRFWLTRNLYPLSGPRGAVAEA